jgi:epsilon-lactone hydrolase
MSIQASQMSQYIRSNIQPHMNQDINIEALHAQGEAMVSTQTPAPKDVQFESIHLSGIPTERVSTPVSLPHAAILYLHGGGFHAGSASLVRPITWRLAKQTRITVYAIDYRLAPEHPYPAGLDDCIQAYNALLEQGISASSIIVAGDSAGGDLTLALGLRLKAENKPQPAALVGLSANTDLTYSGASFNTNLDSDVMLTPKFLKSIAEIYAPQADLTNPSISPLYGNVAGLPPTYLLVSAAELLLDDSTRMAEKMKTAGVAATLDIWPELWHDWTAMSDQVPEGEQALEKIATFMSNHIKK